MAAGLSGLRKLCDRLEDVEVLRREKRWPKEQRGQSLINLKCAFSARSTAGTSCASVPDGVTDTSPDFRAGSPTFRVWLLYSLNM